MEITKCLILMDKWNIQSAQNMVQLEQPSKKSQSHMLD